MLKLLLATALASQEYPKTIDTFEFVSVNPSQGYGQNGTISVRLEDKNVDPTF